MLVHKNCLGYNANEWMDMQVVVVWHYSEEFGCILHEAGALSGSGGVGELRVVEF